MLRKFQFIAGAAIVIAIVAGCQDRPKSMTANSAHEQKVEIGIDNFTFSPANVEIAPGTRVTWINHDDVPHTATSTTKIFASRALDTDDSFSFVFTSAGTYPYFCAVHPHMTGTIVVKPTVK